MNQIKLPPLLDTIKTNVLNQAKRDHEGLKWYMLILNVIGDKFEGKTVSKRIETAVKNEVHKTHPNMVVSYSHHYSWFEISLWENNYNDKFTYQLCYENDPTLGVKKFAERNTWVSVGAPKRLADLQTINLDEVAEKIVQAMDKIAEATKELESLESNLPYGTLLKVK